jgi:predicted lipid-binding transport protein (Tim44 family)
MRKNMKPIIPALMLFAALTFALDADAQSRRLGGGRSTGKQSSSVQKQATPPPAADASKAPAAPAAAPAAPAATPQASIPPKPASPWKGILGGALLGLGLGALFSHLGIGGAMAGILGTLLTFTLIGGVIYLAYRFFFRKPADGAGASRFEPAYAGAPAAGSATDPGRFGGMDAPAQRSGSMPFQVPEIGSAIEPRPAAGLQSASPAPASSGPFGVTPDFDVPAFLRSAKTYFIRLQAAWDKGESADLRDFTTPEMFGELKLQLQERGAAASMTDVVTLDAELLGLDLIGEDHLASVKFTGTIKDSPAAAAETFAEVWNIQKRASDKEGWLLAGIQQIS